jgi:hypothetical protein
MTKRQRALFRFYRDYRQIPPSFLDLMPRSLKGELLLVAFFGTSAALCYLANDYPFMMLMMGMLLGALARDIGNNMRTLQIWPVFVQVLNWDRIDMMLDQGPEEGRA